MEDMDKKVEKMSEHFD